MFWIPIIFVIVIAFIVAGVGGSRDKAKMITVSTATNASIYVDGEINLLQDYDKYCYSSQQVIHTETHSNPPNGTGGFSNSSGSNFGHSFGTGFGAGNPYGSSFGGGFNHNHRRRF